MVFESKYNIWFIDHSSEPIWLFLFLVFTQVLSLVILSDGLLVLSHNIIDQNRYSEPSRSQVVPRAVVFFSQPHFDQFISVDSGFQDLKDDFDVCQNVLDLIEDEYAIKQVYILKFCLVIFSGCSIVPTEAVGATEIFVVSNHRVPGFNLRGWFLIVGVVLWCEWGREIIHPLVKILSKHTAVPSGRSLDEVNDVDETVCQGCCVSVVWLYEIDTDVVISMDTGHDQVWSVWYALALDSFWYQLLHETS